MKEKKNNKKDVIVINRLFAGGFWKENLGYEGINLISADKEVGESKGKNYVYLMPYGDYSKEYKSKIQSVVFVKGLGAHELEVLGYATKLNDNGIELPKGYKRPKKKKGESDVDYAKKLREDTYIKQFKSMQDDYVKNIKFGGQTIKNIFKENKDEDISYYVTFEAREVKIPKKRVILIDSQSLLKEKNEDNEIYLQIKTNGKNNQFARTSLKFYIEDKKLLDVLNNDELWEERKRDYSSLQANSQKVDNIFEIINKEDDELVFSDMFAYYFRRYKVLSDGFFKEINEKYKQKFKGKEFKFDLNKSILREKYNIDLLVEDDENIFIIENKINSDINGKVIFKDDEKLEENEDSQKDLSEKKRVSQLKKYIELIENKNINKNIIPIILMPNHNVIDLSVYDSGDKYIVLTYDEIFNVFNCFSAKLKNDKYFEDFLAVLKRHSEKSLKELVYKDLLSRFKERIEKLNRKGIK